MHAFPFRKLLVGSTVLSVLLPFTVRSEEIRFTDTAAPLLETRSPYDNAGNVSLSANISLTFNEIVVATGTLVLHQSSDARVIETVDLESDQVTGSRTTVITINPSVTLTKNTSYFITFDEGTFTDLAGNPLPGVTDTSAWNFTTINSGTNTTLPSSPVDYHISNVSAAWGTANSISLAWEAGANVNLVNILVSGNEGETWTYLTQNSANTSTFSWNIPASFTASTALFKVQSTDRVIATGEADSALFALPTSNSPQEDTSSPASEDSANIFANIPPGTFIKSADFSTIYLVTDTFTRRPFANEAIFFTYADSFDDVVLTSNDLLAQLPLGIPLLPQAGSTLVKTAFDPRVYAIGANDQLTAIASEAEAAQTYGSSWQSLILDIDQALFWRALIQAR